ncbi:MAG TPA: phosphatidylinositol-specific phospholipase C/glycerophosphodiester phosphodiesterase family protein [Mucilaginibacter sp.]
MKTHTVIFNPKLLKTGVLVLLSLHLLSAHSQSIPLPNAFAHNDYCHKRPLFDALENGYTNIEADIFLEDDELIVAHINPFLRETKTLENLYFKPLLERVINNEGQVYKGYNDPVILMIDIKTGANNTYRALEPLLEKYRSILSSYDHGQVHPRAITVVLSGHKPYNLIKKEDNRFAFIDEDLRKIYRDTSVTNVYKLASCKYSELLKWRGKDSIPDNQRRQLCAYVIMAHKYGEKVRLWASPENKLVWKELLRCGVDLINTDRLSVLKDFLVANKKAKAILTPVLPEANDDD